MLYGNKKIRDEIILKAQEFAKQNNVKIIFGANEGSISKGIPYFSSDYDTRFLFVSKSFFNKDFSKIFDKPVVSEENIVYRDHPVRYYSEVFDYEIDLWDCETFFRFLYEPRIGDNYSIDLYHMLGSTLASPFLWDPYGLSNKLLPILNKHINIFNELNYWEKYFSEKFLRPGIGLRLYMDSIHAALSILWILNYKEFPPVYIETLLTMNESNKFPDIIKKYYMCLRHTKPIEKQPIPFVRDKEIDEWLHSTLESCRIYLQNESSDANPNICKTDIIQILEIIRGSLKPYGINKIDDIEESSPESSSTANFNSLVENGEHYE